MHVLFVCVVVRLSRLPKIYRPHYLGYCRMLCSYVCRKPTRCDTALVIPLALSTALFLCALFHNNPTCVHRSTLDSVLSQSSSSSSSLATGISKPLGTLAASASTGGLGVRFRSFHGIAEESPWERKHRMERATRRRDAGIRAKGLAVNSSSTTKVS